MNKAALTLSSTAENYLKAVYARQQGSPRPLVPLGKLAEDLAVTPGTVTTMIKGLADAGLVRYETRRGARLTREGERLALHVLRRHRLIELFLVEVMGYDWSEVHNDAEILEHVVSEKLLDRIDRMLGHPTVDPHGDPIPAASGHIRRRELVPLHQCPAGAAEVARITDHAPDFLRFLNQRRLTPGTRITILERDEMAGVVTIEADDGAALPLGLAAAEKILVVAPD